MKYAIKLISSALIFAFLILLYFRFIDKTNTPSNTILLVELNSINLPPESVLLSKGYYLKHISVIEEVKTQLNFIDLQNYFDRELEKLGWKFHYEYNGTMVGGGFYRERYFIKNNEEAQLDYVFERDKLGFCSFELCIKKK